MPAPTPLAAVSFYSSRELPFGILSNFARTPLVIARRKYSTVEHWYQSHKAEDPAARESIRSASTPAQAKELGRACRAPLDWNERRVPVMYAGLVAKFRQNPEACAVLLDTADLPIHEAGDDPFWGYCDGEGADWLGRLLMLVRRQLRTFLGNLEFDMVRTALLHKHVVGYQAAAGIRQARDSGECWLFHMVRKTPEGDPEETLRRIIAERKLRARLQPNGEKFVSFTAMPRCHLVDRVFGVERDLRICVDAFTYSPFGVAIPYDYARELGIAPVIPVAPWVADYLPKELRYLIQYYDPESRFDWTHEQEWRSSGDVELHEGLCRVLLPSGDRDLKIAKF